jgi:Fe-S-cluster containining protein
MIIALDEIKVLAEQRRDEFDVMRYQLQYDDDLKEEDIDALAESVAQPIIAAIDCTQCANCCRNLDVQLGEDDLQRLAEGLNVPIEAIRQHVEHIPSDDPDIVGIFKPKPCAFLEGNFCSVYAHRPTACRDYPQFTPDFRWMLNWMIEGAHLCPIIYNVLDVMSTKVDALQRGES